ncbi:hypothetical protein QQP08_007971 [Theobroma cacao]|nr:hypothetical protein QQP08_007971 [Theobroma cacao]
MITPIPLSAIWWQAFSTGPLKHAQNVYEDNKSNRSISVVWNRKIPPSQKHHLAYVIIVLSFVVYNSIF